MENATARSRALAPPFVGAVFDLSRGRQAALSVAQPAIGAVVALGAMPEARIVVVGLAAALCGYFAVFALNDVLDRRTDTIALGAGKAAGRQYDIDVAVRAHPLAQGDLPVDFAIAWVLSLAAVAAALAYALSPACLALFATAALLEFLYCGMRKESWTKTFVSGLMVGIGALAGWVAVAPLTSRALVFFALISVWEIAGRNIPNDLSDISADRAVGITTVPTVLGVKTAGRAVLAGALACVVLAAMMPVSPAAKLAGAGLAFLMMAGPASLVAHRPSPEAASTYFNRASLYPAVLFLGYWILASAGGL